MQRREFTFSGAAAAAWKRAKRHTAFLHEAGYFLLGLVSLATVTGLYFWLDAPLVAAAFTYLVVLVLWSLVSNFSSLIVLSLIGVGCLNYFFTPPIYSFRIDYPQDLITISAFVITSLVINFLVTRVRVEQRDHMRTSETLRDANQRLEVTNKALRIENVERKQAEQALREGEARIRRLVDANIIGTFIWDFDGRILEANEAFLDIVGYDHEDLAAGRIRWTDLTPPEWRDRDTRLIEEHKVTGTLQPFEKEYFRKDGSRVPVLIGGATFEEGGNQGVAVVLDLTERKRAEVALRDSEEALRRNEAWLTDAQRLSHTGTWVLNPTTMQYLYWSDENYRIWGFDPLQGPPSRDSLWQRIHDRDKVWEEVQEAVRQKKDYSGEFKIVLPNGTVKYLAATSHHLFSTNGELVEVIGTNVDVTERKRAEQALRDSEAKFRDYAETASDWLCEMGPDYKFTLLSENAFGSGAADRIGTACWDHALDLETEPEKWRLLQETVFSRKPFRDFVYQGLSSDGSPMHVRASGKPLFDANGEFCGYRGTCSDVTEITRAQEALRESERSSRSVIDGIAGLVVILAPNGELETVNRQVFEYFGRSLEELKNWGTSDAVHPEDLPRILEFFKRAIASGIPFNYELRLRRFDGEYRWFDTRHVPIRDDSARIARWYILATDIEDRTQALARLEQMQSEFAHMNRVATMGQLTASITHEVNQPITAAVTYALAARRFLSADPPNFCEVDDALSLIVKEGNRAGEVVERVRALVKKVPARKDAVAIGDAILEVIALTRTEAANNSVSVRARFAEGLPRVEGDRVQLQQVMLNLIVNAIQAMGGIGERARELQISIDAVPSEGGVRVGVRDTGPGLSPESLSRLFEPFYTTKPEGMGMGLSICRSIIEAHGGRLWAIPCEPQGALFQFTIPATCADGSIAVSRSMGRAMERPS
jgi:PAS domain S-box-containing protein